MSEVKRHWPEDVVGTGEQYVLASDFDATEAARVKAEAECERLRGEVAELDALRQKQSNLLSATAIVVRGPEPALTRYSHADIPSRVKVIVDELAALKAQHCRNAAPACGSIGFDYSIKTATSDSIGKPTEPADGETLKVKGIGNWIDQHAAQQVVDEAQDEINKLRLQVNILLDALQKIEFRLDCFVEDENGMSVSSVEVTRDIARKAISLLGES